MTKAFLPHLLKSPEATIVNVSSMGGFLPVPGQSIYGAAKAAVKLFTEGLRSELAHTNVKVTVVFPGAVNTHIKKNSGIIDNTTQESTATNSGKKKSSMQPLAADKAAGIIIDAIERDRARVLVGSDSALMDFLYRLNPDFAADLIFKQMKSHLPA